MAYVEGVSGDSFTVSEMNYVGWDRVSSRTISNSSPGPNFLGFVYGK